MSSKYPAVVFVFDRYKKATLIKPASIELRITYNKKQKYISTGIRVLQNQWKKGRVVNTPDATQCNKLLDKLLMDVRNVIIEMVESDSVDIFQIPKKLNQGNNPNNFIDFCIQRSEIRKYGKTKDSQERYNRFLRLFKEWNKIINFEDINENNIITFDQYLIAKHLKPYSRWNNYHRFLNSFIIDAVKEGFLQRNPYSWLSIDRKDTSLGIEKYLSIEEFIKLKRAELPTESLQRVRDLFIFQTYTCLSYSDLKRFDSSKITKINNTLVYADSRQKTLKEFVIPLLSPALDILRKYNDKLPIISNVKYNQYLKIVAQAAGIEKPISSHWARHTGATLLLNEGVDIHIVSKICGHSSIKITEKIYAKLLNRTVVEAVEKIKSSHLRR